jgi:hypothetical protein
MDLDEAAAELYGTDLDDFMAARTRLVAHARADKDRPLATAVAGLKKPTRSAWLVNLLTRDASERLGRLSDLAGQMAAAHQGLDVQALRALGAERQQLVSVLTADALAAGAQRGYQATEAVRAEVAGTIAAAVADAGTLAEVLAGRTVKPLSYSGFGFPLMAGAAPAPTPAAEDPAPATEDKAATADDPDASSDPAREARRQAEAALEQATQALQQARADVQQADAAASDAGERLDRASQEVADLRAELRRAEETETAARRAAGEAADRLHDARTGVQQAEQALAEAARALAAVEAG